ncbi:hypothetical protein B5F12_09225, partial [Pseudoflavonifractor sp. An176]|uniref:hypothetical protein n=1 Tax=Pseudoflavonifractor sp. An176 TaxID=1965572 RepID=UPI000B558D88
GFCMPKTLRKFHILDSFLLLRVKKDVPQNLRFATHPFLLGLLQNRILKNKTREKVIENRQECGSQ